MEFPLLFARNESFLVCVHSSWFVGEADLACIALDRNGIPCHIENEHFHVWHWFYASITGGFKVLVPREHAEVAAGILQSLIEAPSSCDEPAWQCSECGRTMDGDWDRCWFCTTSRNGGEDSFRSAAEVTGPVGQRESGDEDNRTQAAAVVILLLVLFWMTGGSLGAVVIGAGVAMLFCHLREARRGPSVEFPGVDVIEAERRMSDQPLSAREQSYRRREAMGNRVVQRALLAAMYGFAWFFPLLILAAILLLRLDSRLLTPWTRQQARMGWCLIAVGLLLHMLLVISLMGSPLDRVGLLGRWD